MVVVQMGTAARDSLVRKDMMMTPAVFCPANKFSLKARRQKISPV
jgi:hypothetical protein